VAELPEGIRQLFEGIGHGCLAGRRTSGWCISFGRFFSRGGLDGFQGAQDIEEETKVG
jgi:hypothetical protein